MSTLTDIQRNPLSKPFLPALYNEFVSACFEVLNPMSLAQFCIGVTVSMPAQEALEFISAQRQRMTPGSEEMNVDDTKEASKEGESLTEAKATERRTAIAALRAEPALLLLDLHCAVCQLNLNEVLLAKPTLELANDAIQGDFPAVVHAKLYEALALSDKVRGLASGYFKNSLLYLGYVELDTISLEGKVALAHDMCLSALVGEDIYNFGELLQHPVLQVLASGSYQWLFNMLFAANSGDIDEFENILGAHGTQALQTNADYLRQKIRILALMEMVFRRASDDRTLSFDDISRTCQLPVPEVELLVMKALSLELIKGTIDQVEEIVTIKWVQPRVLNKDQAQQLCARLGSWTKSVHESILFVEQSSPDLFTA